MTNESDFRKAQQKIKTGEIQTLSDLLRIVKKTPLSNIAHITQGRMTKILVNPSEVTMKEVSNLADALLVDRMLVLELFHREAQERNSPAKE